MHGWDPRALPRRPAQLASRLVAYTFADGLHIDMEHLTPFASMSGDDEFGAFVTFVTELRSEFGQVATMGRDRQCKACSVFSAIRTTPALATEERCHVLQH